MANSEGTYSDVESSSYQDIEPVSNDNDKALQSEINKKPVDDEAGDKALDINSNTWQGMESGAVAPGKGKSTQSSNWLENVPDAYKNEAIKWASQQGVVKVTPLEQRQKFTYSTVAYIAEHQEEPKTQIFPITDVEVTPHQITWDFYDTTEGRVGVSNAVEDHMIVEFDVYLSELVAMYWTFGENNQYNYYLPTRNEMKKRWKEAVENGTYLNFEEDMESTTEFIEFRSNFMQQHNGWVCRFASHTFGVFQGVINSVKYSIGGGESFAKWHIKIEEAIFLNEGYSTSGQKPQAQTSDGSQTNSGDATSSEQVSNSSQSGSGGNTPQQ